MNKQEMRFKTLESMGIDVSKYNQVIILTPKQEEVVNRVVEDKQVENKTFRRWITAQTFKMLYEQIYDYQNRRYVVDWNAYLRCRYTYQYQFDMMLKEIEDIIKFSYTDEQEFEVRSTFFSPHVVVRTCTHYVYQFEKYVRNNMKYKYHKGEIVKGSGLVTLANYGVVDDKKVEDIINKLNGIIRDMERTSDYKELLVYLKQFMKVMNRLPSDTPKCPEWKDAFKGAGAWYSLQNMILYHGCILRGCENKHDSLDKLINCLYHYEGYQIHALLKDTIKYNNFNLGKSIKENR